MRLEYEHRDDEKIPGNDREKGHIRPANHAGSAGADRHERGRQHEDLREDEALHSPNHQEMADDRIPFGPAVCNSDQGGDDICKLQQDESKLTT